MWMVQKAAVTGNWWLAASSWQHACTCVMSYAEFFGKISNHPGDSSPPWLRFSALWILAFPKTKITFWKGRDFRPSMRVRKIWLGSWWRFQQRILQNIWTAEKTLGELCEVPRCLLWRGLRYYCPMYDISCIFFNKCLHFSQYKAEYLLDRHCISSASNSFPSSFHPFITARSHTNGTCWGSPFCLLQPGGVP